MPALSHAPHRRYAQNWLTALTLTRFDIKDVKVISPVLTSVSSVNHELIIEEHHTATICFLRSEGKIFRDELAALKSGQVYLVNGVVVGVVGVGATPATESIRTLAVRSYCHAVQTVWETAVQLLRLLPRPGRNVKALDRRCLNLSGATIACPHEELLPDGNGSVTLPRLRLSQRHFCTLQ